jgi:hypothetical protein
MSVKTSARSSLARLGRTDSSLPLTREAVEDAGRGGALGSALLGVLEETEREGIGHVALHQAVAHDLIFELLVCKCTLIAFRPPAHGALSRATGGRRAFGSALGVVSAPKRRREGGEEAGCRGRNAPLA